MGARQRDARGVGGALSLGVAGVAGVKQEGWRLAVKRAVDRVAAAGGLLVASPVLAATAIAIRAAMGRPVLFVQERPGLHGEPFRLVKFRTMTEKRDEQGRLLPDELRLPWIGRALRSASLDELPQLWNVLKGDMSLVGPRPLLSRYLSRYSREQARRHAVLPGITGWAQINGRNALTWEEKFRLDVWYVDHWSPFLDARILAATVFRVFRRQGISRQGHATMPEFLGLRAVSQDESVMKKE
ncbi:MAG: sugar transferase [Myxococcaceae bacterium]